MSGFSLAHASASLSHSFMSASHVTFSPCFDGSTRQQIAYGCIDVMSAHITRVGTMSAHDRG